MMPEETTNHAAERLQRYAQERREQAGDCTLHPATRQMLQGEVTRTFGKAPTPKQAGWLAWLGSWTGRLAVGATAVVVVAGSGVLWNSRLDRHAMQFARAEMPERKLKASGQEGSRGFVATEQKFAKAEAPAAGVEMDKKNAPALRPTALFAASSAERTENDFGTVPADKLPAMDALAAGNTISGYQVQTLVSNAFTREATLSLAPMVPSYSAVNAPGEVQNPEPGQQKFLSYAAFGAQNSAPASQMADASVMLQNQSVASSGAAVPGSVTATFAGGPPQKLSELAELAKTAPQLVAQPDGYKEQESRARSMRFAVPATPASVAAPTGAASLAGAAELLKRDGGALGAAMTADRPASVAANSGQAGRYYRVNARDREPESRSKVLSAATWSLAESSPVLNDFVIEQTGTTVRVVDGDGSVYDGAIETSPTPKSIPGQDTTRGAAQDGSIRELILSDKTETAPRHQERSFRATGSNVTLRQMVVVNGRFSPGTNAARGSRIGGAQAEAASKFRTDLATRRAVPAADSAFAGQYGMSTNAAATLEGTVRIGTTNQQWFRATRREP